MPDLFSSTTANDSYSLFMSPRDAAYFNDVNTELLEIISNQTFIYWPVDVDSSDVDDIYGESEKKIPRNPITVAGWIQLDEPETVTNNFTTENRRRIEVYLHIDRLTEVGVVTKKGDYIEFDNQFFEITESFVPNFVHGLPAVKIGVVCRCISTREDVFNPRGEDPYNDDIQSSSEDPY